MPSIAAMDGLNPNDVVKAIHIRYLPDATKLDNLCGPAFKDRCSLELRNIIETKTFASLFIGIYDNSANVFLPLA